MLLVLKFTSLKIRSDFFMRGFSEIFLKLTFLYLKFAASHLQNSVKSNRFRHRINF